MTAAPPESRRCQSRASQEVTAPAKAVAVKKPRASQEDRIAKRSQVCIWCANHLNHSGMAFPTEQALVYLCLSQTRCSDHSVFYCLISKPEPWLPVQV
jgi:hypothetical protein